MTITQQDHHSVPLPTPNRASIGLAVAVVLAAMIAASVALFIPSHSAAGTGKPEAFVFQQDGPATGGPVAVPDCAALVGQRITAVAVAVGCTVNGQPVTIPWSTCTDGAHWYAIPDGARVVFGKGGGSWQIADQGAYLTAAGKDC